MTFPENAKFTAVSAVAGVTSITIVVIPAVVGIRQVPHVSADVVTLLLSMFLLLLASTESLRLLVSYSLFYTRGLGIVVLHVMVPEPYRFPLCFLK